MMWMRQSLANRSCAGFSAKQPRILEHLRNLALFLRMAFQPIENYGVIGNMQSVALVGMDGSIDFLCYPEFDSPTVFASLLDDKKGGSFQIRPKLTNVRVRQLYLPDTNILLTRFLAEEGVVELTDYMPIEDDGEQPNEIVRTVSVIRGNVNCKMRC